MVSCKYHVSCSQCLGWVTFLAGENLLMKEGESREDHQMRVPPHCPQALIHQELSASPTGTSAVLVADF